MNPKLILGQSNSFPWKFGFRDMSGYYLLISQNKTDILWILMYLKMSYLWNIYFYFSKHTYHTCCKPVSILSKHVENKEIKKPYQFREKEINDMDSYLGSWNISVSVSSFSWALNSPNKVSAIVFNDTSFIFVINFLDIPLSQLFIYFTWAGLFYQNNV